MSRNFLILPGRIPADSFDSATDRETEAREKSDQTLARFADECESSGFKPSHYYRLLPQITEARARIAKAQGDA